MSGAPGRLLAAVVVVLAVGGVALSSGDRDSNLDRAISRLDDEGRFATSTEAGQTVADISTQLRVDGAACRDDEQPIPRCSALLSASAFSAVIAVTMLECTAPGVYDARVSLGRYLRKLRDFIDEGAQGAAPTLPTVVTC
ncbi:MAG TPA: hypothetical protein VMZ22_06875 [Acidimicrobiales bacterium]|nr:hypothetical protein [Acidimicrobiales bacterium]